MNNRELEQMKKHLQCKAKPEPITVRREIVERDDDGDLVVLATIERDSNAGHDYRVVTGNEWWQQQVSLETKQAEAAGGTDTLQ